MTSGTAAAPPPDQLESGEAAAEAPPKQVALALERLTRAARLIADVRLGADHLLESLFAAFDDPNHRNKTVQLLIKESSLMRQHFEDLRALGRQLEDSGVLNGSLKQRGNSWGLHMPLVCPDGAVVAYAWKRQLAGQAGASSVDRTRLALKAFSDQKRRFFPHLEEKQSEGEFGAAKRHCSSRGLAMGHIDELREGKTLFDILNILDRDVPNVKISTYQRLEWLKKAYSLSCPENENLIEPSKEPSSLNPNKLKTGSADFTVTDETAVIELLVPSVLRVIVSLHPAGSTNPDAVAFFSPDEGGNYIHARGFSVYHVFRHTTEYADKALQYFLSVDNDMALPLLLHWICNYQTLFTKTCSKCGRLLAMDKSLGLLLPPVHRPYSQALATKSSLIHPIPSAKGRSSETSTAYHLGCSVDET